MALLKDRINFQVVVPKELNQRFTKKADALGLRRQDFARLVLSLAVRDQFDIVAKGVNDREQAPAAD